MPPQSRITCYTVWAKVRCSSLSHQLNNVFTDLFTDIHLKSLLESFTGGSPQELSSLAKLQLILQFKLFLGELQKAGIIPQNCKIDLGLISKKTTRSLDDLLRKLILHDIRFTWEHSSQLLLDSDKLICSVCFEWTPMVITVLKQTRTPLSFFGSLETTLNEAEKSSVSSLIESFSLQDIKPFPGREIAKALNRKIPNKGWNYYLSAVECILDLINAHLQADSKVLCAYMCVIFMCGYKFRQSIAVINCIRELQHIANMSSAQLKTFPIEDLEPDQSTQKSDLEKRLEVT